MTDNIDLLVERLHRLIADLLDPNYGGPDAAFINRMVADRLMFEMYGGYRGHERVEGAIDGKRMAQHIIIDHPACRGRISSD